MNYKKLIPVLVIIFIAVIILFAAKTYTDEEKTIQVNVPAIPKKIINKDSLRKADSIKRIYLLGHFKPSKDTMFALISKPYTNSPDMYLRKDVYKAYKIMYDSAKKDGISLLIVSSTRNFINQKSIWEGKWKGNILCNGKNLVKEFTDPVQRSKYILKYSSMPGTSRHHWGTDIDINSTLLSTFETGSGKKVYEWLKNNAYKFGFCQPYTEKDSLRTTGYEEEKWHWSFYPVSSALLLDYKKLISYDDIKGFAGSETAKEIDIINNYVLSVNKNCQ